MGTVTPLWGFCATTMAGVASASVSASVRATMLRRRVFMDVRPPAGMCCVRRAPLPNLRATRGAFWPSTSEAAVELFVDFANRDRRLRCRQRPLRVLAEVRLPDRIVDRDACIVQPLRFGDNGAQRIVVR